MPWKPTFATGEFAGDYTDLKRYLEKAKEIDEKCYDDAILKNEDFEWIRKLVEEKGKVRAQDLLNAIEERMINRVCDEIASEALNMDKEHAKRRVARLLASWLLEAAMQWGVLTKSNE